MHHQLNKSVTIFDAKKFYSNQNTPTPPYTATRATTDIDKLFLWFGLTALALGMDVLTLFITTW